MKANRLRWFLLFLLVGAVFQLADQQSEADGKLLAEIRAKAEKGDAQTQCELGTVFTFGKLGVAKDEVEAVKWYPKAAEQNDVRARPGIAGALASTALTVYAMSEHLITPRKSRWESLRDWCKSWSPQVKQGVIAGTVAVVLAVAG